MFEVMCDNKKSYNIEHTGKTLVLVRCDRLDAVDNERGRVLAEKISVFLNSLPQDELKEILPK